MAIRGNVSIMRETSLTYLLNVRMIDCLLNNRNHSPIPLLSTGFSLQNRKRLIFVPVIVIHSFSTEGGDLFHEPVAGVRIAKKDPPRYNIARDLTAPFPIPN